MYEQLVEFVKENYAGKIVEVGVGHRVNIAQQLKENMPAAEVLVTDKEEAIVRSYSGSSVRALADDVLSPSLQIYQGASLIYSLNPPVELVPELEKLAVAVGADLLVRPMSDEEGAFYNSKWRQVLLQGRRVGWLLPATR